MLQKLDETGLAENTLVIFTSDNGFAPYVGTEELEQKGHYPSGYLRGYKSDVWEGGHRVPLIIRWPGRVAEGSENHQLVHQADFMATCAEIVGADLPEDAGEDSFSLVSLLKGADGAIRRHAVSQSSQGLIGIRQGDWKLIFGQGSGGWGKGSDSFPAQLYNLRDDISESNNLYEKYPDKVAELTRLMEKIVSEGRSTPGEVQFNDHPFAWRRFLKNNR